MTDPNQVTGSAGLLAVRLTPSVSAAEAEEVVRRRLGGGQASARLVHHPFWHVRTTAHRRRGPVGVVDVFVDAKGGSSFITHVPTDGEEVPAEGPLAEPAPESIAQAARDLAGAALRKRYKLGAMFDVETSQPRGVLKPNWIVTGQGKGISARMIVDGFDGSHWVIEAKKTS